MSSACSHRLQLVLLLTLQAYTHVHGNKSYRWVVAEECRGLATILFDQWLEMSHCLLSGVRYCHLYLRQSFVPQGSQGLPKGRLDKHYKEGVMFITYSLLIASLKKATLQTVDDQNVDTSNGTPDLPDPKQQGVLPGTRLFHVVEWLAGADKKGDCLIILDECHKAKNLIAKEGRVALSWILRSVFACSRL